jgi:ribosome-binding ATPase YchF (GTP1/OBG family)
VADEEAVKKAGKLRQQGKKYVVQDGDVIYFKFNV